jgi:hypothetical protein
VTSTLYDPVMNALLSYLQAQIAPYTFLSYQRGIVIWEQLIQQQTSTPIIRQPALFLYDGVGFGGGRTEYRRRGKNLPPIRIIHRTIVLYAQETTAGGLPGGSLGGPTEQPQSGDSIFSGLIEAVESALNIPDFEGALTLGGLVDHCFLDGEGVLISPDIDPNGQGMATLPVQILVP